MPWQRSVVALGWNSLLEMRLTLLSIWMWSVIVLATILGFFASLAVRLLVFPFDRQRLWTGWIFRRAARLCVLLSPFWRLRLEGAIPSAAQLPVVVVSNHVSHLDVFMISHLPWEMKWLGKQSLFRVPFLGWCMYLAGDIPVVRGEKKSGQRAMERCLAYLAAGVCVAFFPEGTRSPDGQLQPFRMGAFKLAMDAGVPILPVAICGTQQGLSKHSWRFGDAHAVLRVGPLVSTASFSQSQDLSGLRDKVHAMIRGLLHAPCTDGEKGC